MKKIPKQGLTGAVLLREAAVTEFKAIIDLVRGALNNMLYPAGTNDWVHIEAIYPDRVVIEKDGKNIQFPYTIDANNTVAFGNGVQVIEEYVALSAKEAADVQQGMFIEAAGEADSGKWLIKVIQAGLSLNGIFYPDAVLREAAHLFNGARVFVKGDVEHTKGLGKDFRQLEAGLSNAQFIEGVKPDTGVIQAVMSFIVPGNDIAIKVREAYARDMASLFGFSIDADGTAKNKTKGGKKFKEATSITKVSSVDLIVEPGAGGQLIRMVESTNPNKETDMWKQRMLEAVMRVNPGRFAGKSVDDIDDTELESAFREAFPNGSGNNQAGNTGLTQEQVNEQIRMVECRANMRTEIATSTLPQVAKDKLLAEFSKRERFVEADVTTAITGEREYLAKFAEAGKVNLDFGASAQVEDRSVKIADMLAAFFDPSHKDHRNVHSFKECYIEITGDKDITGLMRNVDRTKLRESAGVSFRESIDTSTFSEVLGDSITRRMQEMYTGMTDLQGWRGVCTVGRANDFRIQHSTRVGGYGNLQVVGQGDPYPELQTPGDDESTWSVAKRGGTERITLEAVKNDDVRLITKIPGELALSAANTLYEFTFDFFRLNPISWDGVALYHASHGNLFTAALSSAEYKAHRLAMQKQVRSGSGKRLGNTPAMLLVPFDQQDTAYDLFVRGNNNDKTFIQSLNPAIITVNYWADGTDWVTLADPKRFGVLEIDFLDGREEPDLFVQDSPTVGSMFSNDQITYKIRHIYGGNWLVDAEKGTTKAVVAG